jgi:hypothetical protein
VIVSLRRAVVPFLVVASASVTLVPASARAQTYMDPTHYLSRADSPLRLTKPAIEDFEDGLLNLLGTSATTGGVIGPGALTDSVDGDDGVIDGSGTNGNSFFSLYGTSGITFTFDPYAIGGFPTSAGLVWTDGGLYCNVYFEAFDGNGVSLGEIGPYAFGDGSNSGETAEDRFFGIVSKAGISAIKSRTDSGGIEVDHVQYSYGALSFEANATQYRAGDKTDFTIAGGKTNQPVLCVVVGVNGAPVWIPFITLIFDNAGQVEIYDQVPSGLAGNVIDFAAVGYAASGALKFSNVLALTFN